jgi:hypothetical protein
MSTRSKILEGLATKSMINESSYSDLPLVNNSRKLQKLISQKLTDKYQKLFKDIGSMGIDIDIYTHRDDKSGIDDVVSSISFAIVFDKLLTPEQIKEVQKICKKYLINYPDFKYEKSDNSFWFESDNYDEIIDIFDTIEHTDKVNLNKMYSVMYEDDVENYCTSKDREEKLEKQALNSWFNSQRLI